MDDNETVRHRKKYPKPNPEILLDEHERDDRNRKSEGGFNCLKPMFIVLALFSCAVAYGYFNSPVNAIDVTGIPDIPLTGLYEPNGMLSRGKQ